MKASLQLIVFLLISSIALSQEKAIEVVYNQDKEGYIFNAKNNRDIQYEVTLTITPTNLKGYRKPITKLVPANSTIDVTKLYFIPKKRGSFKYKYSYQPKMTEREKAEQENKLAQKLTADIGDINDGIVVFAQDGCPRCHYTTNYLLENNIDFKYINITGNNDKSKLMWQLVKKDNPQIKSFTMPVILVDGKISYNIKDLNKTVSNLRP